MKARIRKAAPKAHGVTTLLTLLVSITAWSSGYAQTRYVWAGGAHVAPFTSWSTAATNIQDAVDSATDGDTVMIAHGTYVLSSQIEVTKGITVVGIIGAESTIVDGNDSTPCFYVSHSNAVVEGFTITGNSGYGGGGVLCDGGTIQNCIVYDNTAPEKPNFSYSDEVSSLSFTYTCTIPDPGGLGNITNDPQFVDANILNFHLSSTSPCIDAGTNQPWMVGATDLDGNPRIFGSTVDLGAYEWPHAASFVDIKANGTDDLVVVGQGEPLIVTASLVAEPAIVGDTWILAMTSQAFPFDIFSCDLNQNSWVPWLFTLYSPSAQGAIPHLRSETLLQSSGLPGGLYIFYLGYDPVQNRWIDFDTLEIDAVPVLIGN